MGLIRKTLAVSTLGLVRPSSKKQRVAKAQLKEMRAQTQLMRQEADQAAREVELAEQARIRVRQAPAVAAAVERERVVSALWSAHKRGEMTREQFDVAYRALPPLET